MLSKEQFDFIAKNKNEDPRSLALKPHTLHKESMGFLLTQIKQKQRVAKKLPTWAGNNRLLFAHDLSAEQCSSEITAAYKSSLFSGKTFVDLTGGLGVDTWYLSKRFEHSTYVEMNSEMAEVAAHNFKELEAQSIEIINQNGIDFLINSNEIVDLIYIDPDRRHSESRVYDFKDSLPNILEHLDLFLQKGKQVLVKGSPMLHIETAKNQLKYVRKIWVVSHKNECKEILFLLDKSSEYCQIEAVELETTHGLCADYHDFKEEKSKPLTEPKKYVYDPFVCFRKAELVAQIEQKYTTSPTQLPSISSSDELVTDFSGRCFELEEFVACNAKIFKSKGIKRVNIISRAHQLDANSLHTLLKLDRGGDVYVFAFHVSKQKVSLAICKKIF